MPVTELIRNMSQTIGTSPVVVSEELIGQQRNVIVITNTSSGGQVITISASDEAVAGKGIVISPGGQYVDSADSGYKPTNTRITAVSNLAGGTIAIHERVLMRGY